MERPRKILRDNIYSVTDTMIRKFAVKSGITEKYKLANGIFDEFRNWAHLMLKAYCKQNAETKKSRYLLDPKDLDFVEYDAELRQEYDEIVHMLPFKRLIIECFQDSNIYDALISKDGLYCMTHYFCDKSIEFFTKVKDYKDANDTSKLVSVDNMQRVAQTYNLE